VGEIQGGGNAVHEAIQGLILQDTTTVWRSVEVNGGHEHLRRGSHIHCSLDRGSLFSPSTDYSGGFANDEMSRDGGRDDNRDDDDHQRIMDFVLPTPTCRSGQKEWIN
jgi:hypothetical protein